MTTINFEYRPLPIHGEFHRSTAYERALFGAFGSGKTYAIAAEAIAWCLEQPGIRGLITRKTVPELRDTTETVFFEVLPPELRDRGEVRRIGGHVEKFTFPNGSTVLFRSIDDWNKHRSLNVGFIAFDEADEFDEETYQGMLSRVRQKDPTPEGKKYGATRIARRGVWSASNPGGHNWLYKRFVDDKNKAEGTGFWRSTSFDNPYLPPEYIQSLLQYPDPWIRRYVLCQFDDFAGQVYEDWGWDTHVVMQRHDPSRYQTYWMGMDPGTRNPTAGLWVVVDKDGSLTGQPRSLLGVAEYEQAERAVQEHAEDWRKLEAAYAPNVRQRIADPSIMTRDRGTNMSLHSQYARIGFNFQLGPKNHTDRIPMLGTLIKMGRFRVTQNCPKTYEAIKDYKWVDLTPQQRAKNLDAPERPVKSNDHLVDCAQYLASRWVPPMKEAQAAPPSNTTDEIHRAIRKQQRERVEGAVNPSHDDAVVL